MVNTLRFKSSTFNLTKQVIVDFIELVLKSVSSLRMVNQSRAIEEIFKNRILHHIDVKIKKPYRKQVINT